MAVPYYRRVGGFDPVAAYFAGMPGSLNEMMMIDKDMGGDDRKIVLAHASRIFVVVCLIAVWFRLVAGYGIGDRSQFGTPFSDLGSVDLLILTGCGIVGYLLGHRLRFSAPALVGPMLVSAPAHLGGATSLPPPSEAVVVAQLVVGAILGCRFIGGAAKDVGSAILLRLGATMLTLCVTLLFPVMFHGLFGQTLEQVLLAYAPGDWPR